MLIAILAAILVGLGCVIAHYEVLRGISALASAFAIRPRQRILVIVMGGLIGHLAEALIFALALWGLMGLENLPLSHSMGESAFANALYISFETFASLGSTATFPVGALRLFTAIEALTGLLLLGWTTAFTYLAMTQFWVEHGTKDDAPCSTRTDIAVIYASQDRPWPVQHRSMDISRTSQERSPTTR